MNDELIEKLSDQAQKFADDWCAGESGWSDAFKSKFADLIIDHERKEHKKFFKRFCNELIEFTGRRDAVVWVARSYGVDLDE